MLTVQDLQFRVDGFSILRGISCSVQKGETVGVIGPNGSGKTTLFNCISGFNRRVEGSIQFQEKEISHLEPFQRARMGIGRVFQNFGIFREMTLLDNILSALEAKDSLFSGFVPWSRRTAQLRIEALELLTRVKLQDLAHQRAEKLSGGQMRLLEITRTVAFGASLFLLDEPTAGVSPRMKDEVANEILQLQQAGKTVLIIEHDINFIQQFCNRIIVLDEGKVVMDGTPPVVRADPRLQEIYFGKTA